MKSNNKIIIVEPSPIVSAGLASFFDDIKQVSIVSQLDRIDRMEEKLAAYNPDVLIINPLLIAYDTNEQFIGNLFVCHAFHEGHEHVGFAVREIDTLWFILS